MGIETTIIGNETKIGKLKSLYGGIGKKKDIKESFRNQGLPILLAALGVVYDSPTLCGGAAFLSLCEFFYHCEIVYDMKYRPYNLLFYKALKNKA